MNLWGRAISRADFYQAHLERVSRSFAFCIAELRSPLREWVALSYLLCRIADTIEDSRWTKQAAQDQAYADFMALVRAPIPAANIQRFRDELTCEMPAGERALIEDIALLLEDLHLLPAPPREIIQQTVLNMTRGMRHFSRERTDELGLHLTSTAELNQYCFFVAGVIGELLSRVANDVCPAFELTDERIESSFHFGLFLQKINVLKDQRADEREGRRLIATRDELVRDLVPHARRAFEYLLAIPARELPDFRLFCSWSIFLGLISIPWIQRSFREDKSLKVSRLETFALLNRLRSAIQDDAKLRQIFDAQIELLKAGDPALRESDLPAAATSYAPDWFTASYEGRLGPSGFASLKLFPVGAKG